MGSRGGGGTLTCLWGHGLRRADKPSADKPVGFKWNLCRALAKGSGTCLSCACFSSLRGPAFWGVI